MTVSSEVNRAGPYLGNGSTTVFGFGFRILDASHLRVILTNEAGVETDLPYPGGYTVSGVGALGGGSITRTPAPTVGQTLTILRDVPFVQEIDLENQGPYYAETVERGFDLAAMRDQEMKEEIGRSLRFMRGHSGLVPPLMIDDFDPGRVLALSSDGSAFVLGPNSSEIAAAQQWSVLARQAAFQAINAVSAIEALTPQAFGAVGDGITDDADAIQDWLDYITGLTTIGPFRASCSGRYLLGRQIRVTRPAGGFRGTLNFGSTEFVGDFNRSLTADSLIFIGSPGLLSQYQAPFDFEGRILLRRGPNCQHAPVGFDVYGMAQSSMTKIDGSSWGNTAIHVHGPQNVTFNDFIQYGGGRTWGYRNLSDTTRYTWEEDRLRRVEGSGPAVFASDVVGKNFSLHTTETAFHFRVLERISATEVRVNYSQPSTNPDTIFAPRILRTGSAAPTCVAGDPNVRIDGNMTIDDSLVGLRLVIPQCGVRRGLHIAKVIATNTALRTVTLSRAPAFSLNPVANPQTETVDIATPGMLITSDVTEGVYSNGASQVRFYNAQFETFGGVALAVDDVELFDMFGVKFHGVQTGYSWENNAVGAIWGNRLAGKIYGECDARYYGQYRIRIGDNSQSLNFENLVGRMARQEKLAQIGEFLPGFTGAVVNFGTVAMLGVAPAASFNDLVDDLNTSYSGYIPPTTWIKPDQTHQLRYMNKNSFFELTGGWSLADGRDTFDPVSGLRTFTGRTRLFGQAATLELWDSDNTGNTSVVFGNNGGVFLGRIDVATGTGHFAFRVQDVTRLALTTRGVNIPGVATYATNGDALAGGLLAGDLYRRSGGGLDVVV